MNVMAGTFRYHSKARSELFEAITWYEERNPGKGMDFVSQVVESLKKIAARPETYRKVFGEFRRINVEGFPYYIIYRVRKKTIYILAIFHEKRLESWKDRI